MATAAKKPPVKKTPARTRPAKREKGTLDYLELALENLNKAREHAQHDARVQIDAAVERVRGTITDVKAEFSKRTGHAA